MPKTEKDRDPVNVGHFVNLGLPITNVHFVGDQHAWAVGDAGHIYHTGDGGQTWERQLGEQLDDFREILFLDSRHGWLAGDNGILLETRDGGKTWTHLRSGTEQNLVGVHFADVSGVKLRRTQRDGVGQCGAMAQCCTQPTV